MKTELKVLWLIAIWLFLGVAISQAQTAKTISNRAVNEDLILSTTGGNLTLDGSTDGIGLGINNPVRKLHIHEDSSARADLLITNDTTGTTVGNGLELTVAADEKAYLWNYENTLLGFGTNNQQRMTVHPDGKVSIGSLSQEAQLVVESDGVGLNGLYRKADNNYADVRIQNLASSGNAAGARIQLSTNSNTTQIFYNSTGNSTAGGTNTFNIRHSGTGGVYLTAGATSWSAVSDMRFKTKQKDFENALDKIKDLSTFTYTLNEDDEKHIHLGMSAQEVVKVIPEVVSGDPAVKMGISYDRMVPVLVKAIQEQQSHIDRLENTIKSLEKRLQQLESY